MAEEDLDALDQEAAQGEDEDEDETEYAQGEVLYNSLKVQGLVTEGWEALDPTDQAKYQLVAEDLE